MLNISSSISFVKVCVQVRNAFSINNNLLSCLFYFFSFDTIDCWWFTASDTAFWGAKLSVLWSINMQNKNNVQPRCVRFQALPLGVVGPRV